VNRRRLVLLLLLLWAAWEVARSLLRIDLVVFTGYTRVGDVVLQGGDPYQVSFNTWPPFFLFVAAALRLLARVSAPGALLLWQLGNVAAIWGVCRLLPRLADQAPPPFTSSALLVPLLMSARLLQEHLQHTQINLYVFLLIVGAFYLFRRRRHASGGLALAAAVSLRAVPGLFLAYLCYKRAWRAAGWTVAFLLLLNVVLPLVAFGPATTLQRWRAWRSVAAAETADPTPVYSNQSLLAALKRVLTVEGGARDPLRYPLAAWPPLRVVHVFYAIGAVGMLLLALGWWRYPPGLDDPVALGELVTLLCLMPIVSPLAWKAHFETLLAGYWLAWRVLHGGTGRGPWIAWWASFGCLTLTAAALIGTHLSRVLESLNVITVGALLVFALSLYATTRLRPRLPANAAAPHRP
jgi:Glycosyltransferase family 87